MLRLGLLRLRFRFCCRLACRQFERFYDNRSKRLPDLHMNSSLLFGEWGLVKHNPRLTERPVAVFVRPDKNQEMRGFAIMH